MKALNVGLLVLIAMGAGPAISAEVPLAKPAEKLPIDLPSITVVGRHGKPDAAQGAKIDPEATTSVVSLPAPPPARATTDLVRALQVPVPPPPETAMAVPGPADRLPYSSIRGGLGGLPLWGLQLGRYDLGLYHGTRIGPALSITRLSWQAHGEDRWSSLRVGEQLALSESGWGSIAFRREEQAPGAVTIQEGGDTQLNWRFDELSLHFEADGGRVAVSDGTVTALQPGNTAVYGVRARAEYTPQLDVADHLAKLDLVVGQQGALGDGFTPWSAAEIAASAWDRWAYDEKWALESGIGISSLRQVLYLDPTLRLTFRPGAAVPPGATFLLPDSPTEYWASLKTEARLPGFRDLYQSRLRVAGNGDLRPQRIEPRIELGVSHRFTESLHGSTAFAYSRARDWIYLGPTPDLLWQPRNFGPTQSLFDVEAQAQFLISDRSTQKLTLRMQDAGGLERSLGSPGLGQRLVSLGTAHDSAWLDGRLQVSVGTRLDQVLLGPDQVVGGSTGLDWLADWKVAYVFIPGWQIYLTGNDWHVLSQEPAPGYFATPGLVAGGVQATF